MELAGEYFSAHRAPMRARAHGVELEKDAVTRTTAALSRQEGLFRRHEQLAIEKWVQVAGERERK